MGAQKHPEEHSSLLASLNRSFVCASAAPTDCQFLLALLARKGFLRRVYTQNVDGMHQRAGVPSGKVVEAHGSLMSGNVVLYDDPLPASFYAALQEDFPRR